MSKSATILLGRLLLPLFQCTRNTNSFLGLKIREQKCPMDQCSPSIWKNGNITMACTENTFLNSWGINPTIIPNRPIRRCTAFQSVPINLHALSCWANHYRLWRICVERKQAIERELSTRIIQDICDEVLSDDSDEGWLKELSEWYFVNSVDNVSLCLWIVSWFNLFVGIFYCFLSACPTHSIHNRWLLIYLFLV